MLTPKDTLTEIGPRDLRLLLRTAASPVELAAGETLFREGEQGDALFVLRSGTVELSVLSPDGRRLGLDILSRGAVFGEIALFDPGPRTATATALAHCSLLRMRHKDLMRAIEDNPRLCLELLTVMGQRMRYMNQQLHDYVFMPVPQRLARKLLQVTPAEADGPALLRLSQSELAEMVGASREAVSKLLSGWKKLGVLDTGRGHITLRDREALQEIAEL